MAIMAENLVSEVLCKVAADDVKCPGDICVSSAAASGNSVNERTNNEDGGCKPSGRDCSHRIVQAKKKRRRKTKRLMPYTKTQVGNRGKKVVKHLTVKRLSRLKQPEAPYNSNRFLIEDHNDLKDIDVDLMAANRITGENHVHSLQKSPHRCRARDSSFTSVESDEDFYYSSPEDEEEFLAKEFVNTYKDVHVEALANLSKTELIQHILCLEEQMDSTQKKLLALSQSKYDGPDGSTSMNFQEEISKLVIANKTLLHENEELRRQKKTSSGSSEDSESDSSSSTCSSSSCSDLSDHEEARDEPHRHMNGDVSSETELNRMDTENVT